MTQNERVLARLRLGPLAAVDFQPPGIVDGGKPIWRVAARVDNLKARGCVIRSERLADGTAVYHLVSEPAAPSPVVEAGRRVEREVELAEADALFPADDFGRQGYEDAA